MTTAASALGQVLAQHSDEDVLQAIQLFVSLRPAFREYLALAMQQEPLKRYAGIITCFMHEKGFGFIQSDEAHVDFGKDTFVSGKEIGAFQPGDTVSFTLVVNKDNKPQARLLQSITGSTAGYDTSSLISASQQGMPLLQQVVPVYVPPPVSFAQDLSAPSEPLAKMARLSHIPPTPPPAVLPVSADVSAGRFVGTITSFFPERHYGFISSEAAHSLFGKDTFLSDVEVGQFKVGDVVSFSVMLNKLGRPQARHLQYHTTSNEVLGSNLGFPAMATPAVQEGKRYSGIITTFLPDKKFGFIQSTEVHQLFGKDVFVSDMEIGAFNVGSAVTFRVVLNKQGRPQARDLLPLAEGTGLATGMS